MDESDLEAEEALPRLGVDQLGAFLRKPAELDADVVDLVRDMVHPRASRGEELPDRGLVAERREQLDAAGADEHGRGLDALVGHLRPVLELGAEEALVRVDGLVQVVDGNAEVMDAARSHPPDANGALLAGCGEDSHGADGLGCARLGLDRTE